MSFVTLGATDKGSTNSVPAVLPFAVDDDDDDVAALAIVAVRDLYSVGLQTEAALLLSNDW